MKKLYSNKGIIFSLVAPGLFMFTVAILAPILLSVYYSFTNYSGLGDYWFIGAENYITLIHDSVFWTALKNSLFLAVGFICIQHPLAIFVAVKLDKLQGKAEGIYRCIYFIPNVISVAVIAYLWKFIYNPNFGLLQKILEFFGYQGKVNPLGSGTAIWAVLVVLIWHGFGWGMLIYYTGVKNIDPVLYEAASIDGASGTATFFRVTLPLMKPVIQVNVTMALISALKQMETVYLLTDGGPGNETQFLASYLYKQAFSSYKYGYGNAISVVFILICLLANLILQKAFQEKEEVREVARV
ncbi:MAG: sugar ABC transporter permease [Lachnospiraceae bacterium]|nr:sugar ABC transporter permease [Lachnospiraceae bacterium]